jgi:hypothetical protein
MYVLCVCIDACLIQNSALGAPFQKRFSKLMDEALLAAQVGLLCLHVSVSACVAFDKRPCNMTTKRRQDHRKWDRSVKYMYTCESGNVLKGV